jgi:hypothetical protein
VGIAKGRAEEAVAKEKQMNYVDGISGATLTGIGAALPWVGGALAVASMLGAFDDDDPNPEISLASLPHSDGRPGVDTPFGPMRVTAKHMGDVGKDNTETATQFAEQFIKPLAAFDKLLADYMTDTQIEAARQSMEGWVSGDLDVDEGTGKWVEELMKRRLDTITDAIGGWVNDIADTANGTLQETYTQVLAIMSASGKAGAEEIAKALLGDGASEFTNAGETAAAAFARLVISLDAVNDGLGDLCFFGFSVLNKVRPNLLINTAWTNNIGTLA